MLRFIGQRSFTSSMSVMATSVKDAKAACRKRIKNLLGGLEASEVERQSSLVTAKALQTEAYRNAKSICVFLSMPGRELSTRELVLQAFHDGKIVYVPYIYSSTQSKSKTMDMLRVKDADDLDSLQPDAWGIPSISPDSAVTRENALGGMGCSDITDASSLIPSPSTLDLVFVPAVAFDREGHRLGHGKGFYDRYLTRYKRALDERRGTPTMPYLAGLALREQILPAEEVLPTTKDDWNVDCVLSADT